MWSLRSRNGCVSFNLCKAFCITLPTDFPLEAWPLPFRIMEFPGAHGKDWHNPKGFFQSLPLPISFFLSVMSGWAERTQTHTGGALKTRAALYLFICAHGGVSWTGMGCITDTAAAFSFNTIFQASLFLTKLSPASHWTIPQLLGSLNCAITRAEKEELNLISNDVK